MNIGIKKIKIGMKKGSEIEINKYRKKYIK